MLGLQEEEEAEEEEDVQKSLRDSIASFKWREREGAGWSGSNSADPIKQQKLQQAASIKRYGVGKSVSRLLHSFTHNVAHREQQPSLKSLCCVILCSSEDNRLVHPCMHALLTCAGVC